MSTNAQSPPRITAERFAMLWMKEPDDIRQVEGEFPTVNEMELDEGEIRRRLRPWRSFRHGLIQQTIARRLRGWLTEATVSGGRVEEHAVLCCLRRNPDAVVVVDLAYAPTPPLAVVDSKPIGFNRPPILAIKILEPRDTYGEIWDRIEHLTSAGSVIWVVDPDLRVVTIYRPDREPEMFNDAQELTTEPELPGFRVPVARIFGG